MVKALIGVTSYHGPFYADGAKTGLFIVEALHPFNVLLEKGFEVDFVSEDGTWGPDEHSTIPDFLNGKDAEDYNSADSKFSQGLKNIKKPEEVNAADYDLIFFSAGHGTLFDYPTAKGLVKIAENIYAKGGVVAAVCHGPAIFASLKDTATGKPLVQGKKVTGFTDLGETQLGVDVSMKEYKVESVEDLYKRLGATYVAPAGPWDDFSIADGRVVTGVNPQSAHSTTVKAIEALK